MEKISIIVPVYNVEKYLNQCIESILAQTYTNFEVLLVNDGSPDNCGSICDEYARKDKRIHVIHQENKGLSAARNNGIDQSSGEYICFVDSDDVLMPEYCRVLLELITSTNADMAACRITRFTDFSSIYNHHQENNQKIEIMQFSEFLLKQLNKEIEFGAVNRLYRREIFQSLRFMEGKLHEDIYLAGDLLLHDKSRVTYIDTCLYCYRQREGSIIERQLTLRQCSPDRIYAAQYLIRSARTMYFPHIDLCMKYAIQYPWSFIDPIYVHFCFHENMEFMRAVQQLINDNRKDYRKLPELGIIQRRRMLLFARSKILYAFNAYLRLIRVYLYHIIKKDAYADGHGI